MRPNTSKKIYEEHKILYTFFCFFNCQSNSKNICAKLQGKTLSSFEEIEKLPPVTLKILDNGLHNMEGNTLNFFRLMNVRLL